jgi:hypothetical protein
MRDDDASSCRGRIDPAQAVEDELAREAVKAVATHARIPVARRQGVHLRDAWQGAMKCRVETGDLRNVGMTLGDAIDQREGLRQMVRIDRDEPAELVQQRAIDQLRGAEPRAAVDDTMRHGFEGRVVRGQRRQHTIQRGRVVRHVARADALDVGGREQRVAVEQAGLQAG